MKFENYKILIIVLLSAFCQQRLNVFAEDAEPSRTAERIFENDPLTRDANVGVLVVDAETGEIIDSYRERHLLPTASTMKVITTATALELLGGDYRWSTFLETDGTIENGILHGDLYIRGTGDPTLGSQKIGDKAFLRKWVKAIKEQGITQIDGAVIADMSAFDNGDALNGGWLWEDAGNYYGMGVFSLNYLDNTMNIVLRSRAIGTIADVVSTEPKVDGVQFENHIRCTEITYDGAYVHGVPFDDKRVLTGSVPSNLGTFGVKGDIPNPGLLLARHFEGALEQSGVKVKQQATFIKVLPPHSKKRTLLYEHTSPALREVVKETNIHSNNLYAEAVFRTLGLERGNKKSYEPASILHSRAVVEQCWRQRGVNWGTTIQIDGCGLAPQNGVAPNMFVGLLKYMRGCNAYSDFYDSLPVAGESGTLRTFLYGTRLQGKVHAKSGSIAHLRAYTGYIERGNGKQWIFSIVVNNGNGKGKVVQKTIERYLLAITE